MWFVCQTERERMFDRGFVERWGLSCRRDLFVCLGVCYVCRPSLSLRACLSFVPPPCCARPPPRGFALLRVAVIFGGGWCGWCWSSD
jgi:hypothetical protein